ncbi:MAG: NAD-dependent epimerase/dehydratase family protein [Verrucomicrobia bacterium]|nr:NAD-dependent epimerase/dehydratase family protein [Verrucomicrobiota bacterium]
MSNSISNLEELDNLLSEPSPGAIETMRRLDGDIILLGVAGKMGPTLARMAKRASDSAGTARRIIGVSRFSSPDHETELQRHGIETIRCDLLNESALQKLPDAPNILYLAGMKFGSTGQESLTWAMNTHLPALVCKKYQKSKIVAFSTGNVYGLVPVASGGSVETDLPNPVGEYAMSCLGRERIFEHFSRTLNIPLAIVRLNYACEMRYGVLVDLAKKIHAGETIDLNMGWLNTLWQADANSYTLQCFDHVTTPPFFINMTGPELLNVKETCEKMAARMDKPVSFSGTAAETALLNNASRSFGLSGQPRVNADQLLTWVVDWVKRSGASLGKPTHFESRDGKF